jgi:hypothetical protein
VGPICSSPILQTPEAVSGSWRAIYLHHVLRKVRRTLRLDVRGAGRRTKLGVPANGTQLVVMPAGGNTWFTVEYRPATNWDQRFTPNATGTQTFSGVVIHEIRDVGMPSDGAGWPKIRQVCYETTIPTSSTGDFDWSILRIQLAWTEGRGVAGGATLRNGCLHLQTFTLQRHASRHDDDLRVRVARFPI